MKNYEDFIEITLKNGKINRIRRKKWENYNKAIEFIKPKSFYDNIIDVSKLQKHLNLSFEETQKIINSLINNNRIKVVSDKYISIIKCDMCDKELDDFDLQEKNNIYHSFGYGSKYDLNIINVNLCCDCYDKIIDKILPLFKVNPLKEYDLFNHFNDDNKLDNELYAETIEEHCNDPY